MITDPAAMVRSLAKAGGGNSGQALTESFFDIVALLAEADDDSIVRTGVALRSLCFDDNSGGVPTAHVAVSGTATLGSIQAPLQGALAVRGIASSVILGDYGGMFQELLAPNSALAQAHTTAVVLLPDGASVFSRLAIPFTVTSAVEAIGSFVDDILGAIRAYRQRSAIPIVLPTLLLPPEQSAMLVDLPSRTTLAIAWAKANLRLLEASTTISNVFSVDMNQLAAHVPGSATDSRLAAYTKSQFTDTLLLAYSRQVASIIGALIGRSYKCLVLDLDGTMWGDTLVDTGPLGVISGGSPVGEAFAAIQDAARQLSSQGVLLAIASKNDEDPVRQALTDNPAVRVHIDDFAIIVANWNPKPGTIKRIAHSLNIGLDSLVFVDDSVSERGAVRAAHPMVRTIAADPNDPASTRAALLRDGVFTTLGLTEEDRLRPQRYRAESKRAVFEESANTLEDYLSGLKTVVTIGAATELDMNRISQLTLRTNQYNLTTIRLDPVAVRELAQCPGTIIKTISCTDRFGDHGMVGALFAKVHDGRLEIVNFVMSCRVLGRNVECAALRAVLAEGIRHGARDVVGTFIRTEKNGRATEFFTHAGFVVTGIDGTDRVGARTSYQRALSSLPKPTPHLRVTIRKENS